MTPEEKLVLYTVLQDIADELRSLEREEQKKNQKYQKGKLSKSESLDTRHLRGVPQRRGRSNLCKTIQPGTDAEKYS